MKPWIKVAAALSRDRRVARISRRLGVPPVHVVGHLVVMWAAMFDADPTGGILLRDDDWEDGAIAAAAMWDGDPAAWVAALVAVRFLRERTDGWSIPSWDEWGGALLAERRAGAERAKAARSKRPAKAPSTGRSAGSASAWESLPILPMSQ